MTSIFTNLVSSITSQSIRDCSRLGKYNEQRRPRPILVHLNQANDVAILLSKRSSLSNPIVLKPFPSPEERANEVILLKERWSLIQSGVERGLIKIYNSRLYINGDLHSEVINSRYQLSLVTNPDERVNGIDMQRNSDPPYHPQSVSPLLID